MNRWTWRINLKMNKHILSNNNNRKYQNKMQVNNILINNNKNIYRILYKNNKINQSYIIYNNKILIPQKNTQRVLNPKKNNLIKKYIHLKMNQRIYKSKKK